MEFPTRRMCATAIATILLGLGLMAIAAKLAYVAPLLGKADFNNTEIYLDTDDHEWIFQAQNAAQAGEWRRHWDDSDNAPYGRPLHWSSPPLWALIGIGKVIALSQGVTLHQGIELAGRFWTPLLFVLVCAIGIPVFAKRFGILPAFILFGGLIALQPVFVLFYPLRPDHHALQIVITLWALFSATLAVQRRNQAPRKAIWSFGAACACLIWIGAFIAIPVVIALVIGTVVALVREKSPKVGLWREFGFAGASVALGAYLIEYAPQFPLRLDINGPSMILGLLLAGEVLEQASNLEDYYGGDLEGKARWSRAVIAGLLIAEAVVLRIAGPASFSPFDPICRQIALTVSEVSTTLFSAEFPVVALIVATVLAGVVVIRRIRSDGHGEFRFLAPSGFTAGLLLLASCVIGRWIAFALVACAFFTAVVVFLCRKHPRDDYSPLLFAAVGVFLISGISFSFTKAMTASAFGVDPGIVRTAQIREAAAIILNNSDGKTPVVVSLPDVATFANYFIGGKTIGTVYWESSRGIERALEILLAQNDEDARKAISSAGVTHIIVPTTPDAMMGPAFTIYGPSQPYLGTEFFGDRLRNPSQAPHWLKLIGGAPTTMFMIYKVLPDVSK